MSAKRLERTAFHGKFERKQANGAGVADGTISGHGAIFGTPHPTSSYTLSPDWQDVIRPGAFRRSLAVRRPSMLLQHAMLSLPIGSWSKVEEDDVGLLAEGQLALDMKSEEAADVYALMKLDPPGIDGLSVGFSPVKVELDQASKTRYLIDVDLFEVSVVTVPAIGAARVTDVKGSMLDPGDVEGMVDLCTECADCGNREEMLTRLRSFPTIMGGPADGTDPGTKAHPGIVGAIYELVDEIKIAKRADTNPKAGTDKYGDVEFADPKNKKYPIDTEAHIRAAWNYIHKAGNADKYSAEDVARIKARIVAAWKKKIDKDGPPAADGKSAFTVREVEAGLRDAGLLSRNEAKAFVARLRAAAPLRDAEDDDRRDAGDVIALMRSIAKNIAG
jgi:HK97 family phage prohead protease